MIYSFVSHPAMLEININNMRILEGRFFEGRVFPKGSQLNIHVGIAYFDKTECLENANNG